MSSVTTKTVEAYDLFARLNGISTGTVTKTEDAPEVEIEFEDEPKKKATKKRTAKAKQPEAPKKVDRVPDLEQFEKLNRGVKIGVQQVKHDIHYKEQVWGIPDRTITYNLEVISNPKVAKDTAKLFKCETAEDLRQAEEGEVRYIKIVSYENIPYRSREIGYIRVTSNNGTLEGKALLRHVQMKENNINADKVKKQVSKVMGKLLGKE